MRSRKDILAFVASVFMTLLLLMACAPTSAHAETRYTVRVFGGNRGSVNSTEEYYVLPKSFAYGEEVNLDDYVNIDITDDKYYFKGYRKSGEDWLARSSFTITEDTDFVVAYGVRGDQVSYTISFIEYGTGRALQNDEGQTSVTFYGNKGDKPVVPYEYVPGYRPRYRNITGTLGDEGTNNWTLEYIAIETPTITEVVTETTTTGTTTGTAAGTTTGTTTGTTEATPGATATGEGTTTGTEGQAQPTTTTETTPEVVAAPPTEEIIDVDTPLAGPDGQTQGQSDQNPEGSSKKDQKKDALSSVGVKLLIAVVAFALALATFFALKRPKVDDGDEKGPLG